MALALYVLTSLTTLLCAVLLLRAYASVRKQLLLWSALCFIGLTVSNLLVIIDNVIFPQVDFYSYRLGATAVAMGLLVFGLVWESR